MQSYPANPYPSSNNNQKKSITLANDKAEVLKSSVKAKLIRLSPSNLNVNKKVIKKKVRKSQRPKDGGKKPILLKDAFETKMLDQ